MRKSTRLAHYASLFTINYLKIASRSTVLQAHKKQIHIVPKKVTNDGATVWLGSFDRTEIKGNETCVIRDKNNNTLKEIDLSKKWKNMLGKEPTSNKTAVFQIQAVKNLNPATKYSISIQREETYVSEGSFRTLPTELPTSESDAFTVLTGSCYHYKYDDGKVVEAVTNLRAKNGYDFDVKLLTGDQVYLDHPATDYIKTPYPRPKLERRFIQQYRHNWEALKSVYAHGANIMLADDHEYHNRYPFAPYFMKVPIYRDPQFLPNWQAISKQLFRNIQSEETTHSFSIGEDLSFFLADTRTNANPNLTQFMNDADFSKLKNWINSLASPGVLVLSQPLLTNMLKPSVSNPLDYFAEQGMTDYLQFPELVEVVSASKHDLVLVAGDVHYSRLAHVKLNQEKRDLYEVITSPMSLIETSDEDAVRWYDTDVDKIQRLAQGRWDLSKDSQPELFPQDFIQSNHPQDRYRITYLKAGSPKYDPRSGKTIDERTEENFSTLRFFKSPTTQAVNMHVECWLPRLKEKEEDELPKKDWEFSVKLQ